MRRALLRLPLRQAARRVSTRASGSPAAAAVATTTHAAAAAPALATDDELDLDDVDGLEKYYVSVGASEVTRQVWPPSVVFQTPPPVVPM